MENTFYDKALNAMSEEISKSDRACDFCNNNYPHLLVCNKQCDKGIYDFLRKQAEK